MSIDDRFFELEHLIKHSQEGIDKCFDRIEVLEARLTLRDTICDDRFLFFEAEMKKINERLDLIAGFIIF